MSEFNLSKKMHGYQLFLKELDSITLEQDRQRALDLYPIYMFDCGQLKSVEQQRKGALRKEELTSKVEWEDYK